MFEKAAEPGFADGDGGGPAKFTKSWLQGELGLVLNSGRGPTRMLIGWPSVTAGLLFAILARRQSAAGRVGAWKLLKRWMKILDTRRRSGL